MQRADKRKFHVIYKITCLINDKFYVGMHSTDNLMDGYFGSGKRLLRSVRKYGKENHKFEVLEFCNSRKELANREKELVNKELIENILCMNLKEGGQGGGTFDHLTREQLLNACSLGGKTAARNGKKSTGSDIAKTIGSKAKQTKRKMFEEGLYMPFNNCWNGRKHSEESKIKMSESSKGIGLGEKNSQFGTCWIYNNETSIKIKKEDINSYLAEGWIKGRKIVFNN